MSYDPLSVSSGNPDDFFGISCRTENDFYLMSCAHASSEDNHDNDIIMTDTGCFSGDNDGSKYKNTLDIRCCKNVNP